MPEEPFPPQHPSDRSDGSDRSVRNQSPATPSSSRPRLRPSGGYRSLRSFQVTTLIYDATVSFCDRFIDKRSRTTDQMIQAARSGRQNIAEGSRASATSSKSELKLINVARASLDELLLDYEDFLRQRGLPLWEKQSTETGRVRSIGRADHPSIADYAEWLDSADPSMVANCVICLIHQANFLLDRQISALEQQFVREGGYGERLLAERLSARREEMPACPLCGRPMKPRTARKGPRAGSRFWGCTGYPDCRGIRNA